MEEKSGRTSAAVLARGGKSHGPEEKPRGLQCEWNGRALGCTVWDETS